MHNTNSPVLKYPDHFTDRAVSFVIYIPSDFEEDPFPEIICQFKENRVNGTYSTNPPFALAIKNGVFSITIRTIPIAFGSDDDRTVTTWSDVGTIVPGNWHYFVIDSHCDYTVDGNGYHKVYMKVGSAPDVTNIILDYVGPTLYNDVYTFYVVLAVYKWDWKVQENVDTSIAAGVTKREYYFDNILIQDEPLLFGTAEPTPPPSEASAASQILQYF